MVWLIGVRLTASLYFFLFFFFFIEAGNANPSNICLRLRRVAAQVQVCNQENCFIIYTVRGNLIFSRDRGAYKFPSIFLSLLPFLFLFLFRKVQRQTCPFPERLQVKEITDVAVLFQLFFILRKKNQHVSTLHVVHHGIMPFSVWMGLKFAPGGHSTFFALLNTFVHIIMYFYYMVAAMGPEYQKYIWWKKYLTSLQMVKDPLLTLNDDITIRQFPNFLCNWFKGDLFRISFFSPFSLFVFFFF